MTVATPTRWLAAMLTGVAFIALLAMPPEADAQQRTIPESSA